MLTFGNLSLSFGFFFILTFKSLSLHLLVLFLRLGGFRYVSELYSYVWGLYTYVWRLYAYV